MSNYADINDDIQQSTDASYNDSFKTTEKNIRQFCKGITTTMSGKYSRKRSLENIKHDADHFQWSEVVDPRGDNPLLLTVNAVHPCMDEETSNTHNGIYVNTKLVQIAGLPNGLFVLVNALSPQSQFYWAEKALAEYSEAEHTNLTNLSTLQQQEQSKDSTASLVSQPHTTANDNALEGMWSKALHSNDGFKSFFKLRWSCLGYHYGS